MFRLGLKVAIADWDEENLQKVAKELVAQLGEANVIAVRTDVSKLEDVVSLKDRVYEAWGEVRITNPSRHPLFSHFSSVFPHSTTLHLLHST